MNKPHTVFNPPYQEHFKVGDIVVAKFYIEFCDGTRHYKGQKIKVEKDTQAYYNVCHKNYERA